MYSLLGFMWIYNSLIAEDWNMHKNVKNEPKHNYRVIQT